MEMVSLWNATKRKLLTMIKIPSPMCRHTFSNSAQNSKINSMKNIKQNHSSIKRLSPFTFWKRALAAGMTVEAAVVLPICLFCLVNLGSAIELIRLHNRLELALWNTGNQLAVYEAEVGESAPASLLTAFYVKNRIVEFAGKDYLEQSPLKYGSAGVQLWESEFLEEDRLQLTLTYSVDSSIPIAGFPSFRMANRYEAHLWNGYAIPEILQEEGVVYVTEYATVYHTNRDCPHLSVSVKAIDADTLSKVRNRDRKKYRNCRKCAFGPMPETVYITDEGETYHYERNCSGLKRSVRSILPDEAEKLTQCMDCAKRDGN